MKIFGNWALAVPLFYITFVVVLVIFVIWTTTQKVELVDENYYDKELVYQKQIEKLERTKRLPEKVTINHANNSLLVSFPKNFKSDELKGEIFFFRPSEKKLDFKVKIETDSTNSMLLATNNIKKGLWKLKIDWVGGDSLYYNEEIVIIN